MDSLKIKHDSNELMLDTPNRNEILKDGPPESSNLNILGRGSYGVVFKAIYRGKQVAVKIMNTSGVKLEAIANEGNILGLRHRNIVHLLKIESTINYGIVIMERFPGQCLQLILDSINLPLEHRIYVTLDLTNALIYCHKRNILHLDVKPQNVLVAFVRNASSKIRRHMHTSGVHTERRYICKLCDFGSSLILSSTDQGNPGRRAQGTVRYMSPEALKEDILTPASDVFSLGVTMWQLKYRQLPYFWIECNESVAYQVVKTSLRPNYEPSKPFISNAESIARSAHNNCLCKHFSLEISHRSLDQIRAIVDKTKTLSPLQPKNAVQRPEKLKNQISRSLIAKFRSSFVELKENLLLDDTSCDIMEDKLNEEFQLALLFEKQLNLLTLDAENTYEELFISCWHSNTESRLKTVDIKEVLLSLFLFKK